MRTCSDQELLNRYGREGSEAAFAELVRRHVDMVHSAAVRLLVDPHLAEDVVQQAFLALARNARKLSHRQVLSSWLHRATRNLAVMTIRREERRRAREQKATTMAATEHPFPPGDESPWHRIRPHLDDALARLSEADRDSIALRFFDRKTAAEIGGILGISEAAAQKRVHRALERLRRGLAKCDVTVPLATLSATVAAHSVQAAPPSVAETLAGKVLAQVASGATTPGIWSGSIDGVLAQPMAAAVVGLLVVSLGTGGYLTGRAAAREHWQAVRWHNALASSPAFDPRPPERIPPPVRFDRDASPTASTTPDRSSVARLLAAAADHFRNREEDPDAWEKGFVLMDRLQPDDVPEALKALEGYRHEPEVYASMGPLIVRIWARTEPEAALNHALTFLGGSGLGLSIEYAAGSWARSDPHAAWQWYRDTTDSGKPPIADASWMWVPKHLFGQWAIEDPNAAVTFLDQIPYGDRDNAIFGIAEAARDSAARPGILAAVEQMAHENQKRELARRLATQWARSEPAAAADWAASLHFDNPAAKLSVMGEVAEEWWPVDRHAVARWLLANAPKEVLGQVRAGLAEMTRRSATP